MTNTKQAKSQSNTSCKWVRLKSVFAMRKLAGFADKTVFVDSARLQTRDAFGSPYLGDLGNDIGFGYCGKVYDVGTGLYDYGFRDYSPVSARFTTVDPIKDGSNWFSYVVNDPVNYVDPLGLETTILQNLKDTLSDFKSTIANLLFPGEITNETTYELFPRPESNKITKYLLGKNFTISPNMSLSEALANNHDVSYKQIALDGLVLPDKSVYKGWSGSKITVTETKNEAGETSFVVIESFGTKLINGIINFGRDFLNNFRTEKKERYGYYDPKEVEAMSNNKNGIAGWRKDVPLGYFNQKEGCTK